MTIALARKALPAKHRPATIGEAMARTVLDTADDGTGSVDQTASAAQSQPRFTARVACLAETFESLCVFSAADFIAFLWSRL